MFDGSFHHFTQSQKSGKIAFIEGAGLIGKKLKDAQHRVVADDRQHHYGSNSQLLAEVAIHARIALGIVATQKLAGANALARESIFHGEQCAKFRGVGAGAAAAPAVAGAVKIGIEDFAKVEMRVGQVKTAERVAGADRLLQLQVDIGDEVRQIVAGLALAYKPEELVGRKVVVVTNLQPRKLRGVESNGMIVAASAPDGAPVLAGFLEDVPVGAKLK